MKAAGIIVEFNPLHNGHVEHLCETRRLTKREHIIAVMSGNFVQRGEPAICDKWRRTQMALMAGVDIVIELPVGYVISGADYFARAGIGLLAATGVVDKICFGSESGDLAFIKDAGHVLAQEPAEYKEVLRQRLSQGLSFAAARGAALETLLGHVPEGLLSKPNNGLGIEYCKALWQLGWPMEAVTSFRAVGGPSATAIRRAVWDGKRNIGLAANPISENAKNIIAKQMPPFAQKILHEAIEANELAKLDDFSNIFRYLLFTREFEMGEGLENRFRRFARFHNNLTELLDAVKTKRYTYTRLQRAALGLIIGAKVGMANCKNMVNPAYIRVLGFRRGAAGLLSDMTRQACLPVITHGEAMDQLEGLAASMLAREFEAGDIYRMAFDGTCGYRHERGVPLVMV